jgi:hypothetical protein
MALQPDGQVQQAADGNKRCAASVAFSPSHMSTAAVGSRLAQYSGRGAGGAFHRHASPSHDSGRMRLPGKRVTIKVLV